MSVEHRRYGPPGTGKTGFLSRQAPLAAEKYGVEGVVICSLTRAAATEIGSRVPDLPSEQVGTLHALCFRGLDRPAIAESGEGLKAWNRWIAGRVPMWQVESQRNRLDPENAPAEAFATWTSDGDRLLAEVGVLRARRTDRRFWPPEAARFMQMWCEWKEHSHYTDFTDLLERGLKELPVCPGAPSVLMADEAQDMSALEFALLRQWAEDVEQLVVVGDQDQALYSWRGSDPEAFTDAPAATIDTLSRSWRVPRAVHAYAVDWIQKVPGRVPTEYLPRLTDPLVERVKAGDTSIDPRDATLPVAEGSVVQAPYRWERPDEMIPELVELSEAGQSVMVLASCGYMLNPLLSALRARGVPYHNPYRVDHGGWNPLGGAGRLLNYLRPDVDTYGEQARLWTWPEVHSWLEPLAAKHTTRRGAKAVVEHQAQPDRFNSDPEPVDLLKLVGLFEDEAAYRVSDVGTDTPAAVDWWWENVRESRKKSLGYSVKVYREHGGKALLAKPTLMAGTIHCSPPDELVATNRGSVPIAELDPARDRLIGYHRPTNSVLGVGEHSNARGYGFERSERPHAGELIVIETDASRTRVTPNHRVVARFDEDAFCECWCVYLMRRGDWWRIGTCTTAHRPYRSGGVSGRLATEQADAGWILGVFDTRRDALFAEAIAQAEYGIPGLTFQSATARSLTHEDLAHIHDYTAPYVAPRAARLLAEHGLDINWPLYTRSIAGTSDVRKRNMRGNFVTEAANLVPLSGRIQLLTLPAVDRKATPRRATVTTEPYVGPVFGLDVPPHHYYGSGGAIVHNSVKGGEADHVFVFPDISRTAFWGGWDRPGPARDAITRQFYVAFTRAREGLHLCRESGAEFVRFPTPKEA